MVKYVEANRSVESHPECILSIYLFDVDGKAVPGVKMKIWAGPPPSGRPPYYEDEDPDNPARRTDSNGKFQFIVAKPMPIQPLDFFVQAVDDSEQSLSDPVHFSFPANEARRVVVTMAAVAAPATAPAAPPNSPEDAPAQSLEANLANAATPVPAPEGVSTAPTSLAGAVAESGPTPKPLTRPKLFPHYLLFGPGQQTGTLTSLIIALDYIIRFAPLVGFSPDEARHAERVTIVGDSSVVSRAVEQSLRAAGCTVTRITASDSYALENVFKQLIDSGSPFPSS